MATNLPGPAGPRASESPYQPADLAEIVRLYGLRHWIEQGYKQIKDELGWADFQVRSDIAIRRHQALHLRLQLLLDHLVQRLSLRSRPTWASV